MAVMAEMAEMAEMAGRGGPAGPAVIVVPQGAGGGRKRPHTFWQIELGTGGKQKGRKVRRGVEQEKLCPRSKRFSMVSHVFRLGAQVSCDRSLLDWFGNTLHSFFLLDLSLIFDSISSCSEAVVWGWQQTIESRYISPENISQCDQWLGANNREQIYFGIDGVASWHELAAHEMALIYFESEVFVRSLRQRIGIPTNFNSEAGKR